METNFSLVGVPSALLLHLDLPGVEDFLEIRQLPVRVALSSESTSGSIEALATSVSRKHRTNVFRTYWWKWKTICSMSDSGSDFFEYMEYLSTASSPGHSPTLYVNTPSCSLASGKLTRTSRNA